MEVSMLAKFSVKKIYTVLVSVILVIVLGSISFFNMTTDLLPNIELPYVVVITPYPGASPEEVENEVTRPLESVLGISSGLSSISSVSNENSSVIFLEYVQSTNMDSAIIEISSSIDQVAGQFDDLVQTPILMRISPDMLPIMVASVDVQGYDIEELSMFASQDIIPAFERIDGVANVDASGLIEREIEVNLDQEAIAVLNERLLDDIKATFAENRQMLLDSQQQLLQAQKQLKAETSNSIHQLSQTSVQLSNAIANLNGLLAQEATLQAQKSALEAEKSMLKELLPYNQTMIQLFPYGLEFISDDMYTLIMDQIDDQLPEMLQDLTRDEMSEVANQMADGSRRLVAIESELQNNTSRLMTFNAMKPQLENGLFEANNAYTQVLAGQTIAAIELAKAEIQIDNGLSQIEQGIIEFDKAQEEALASADLNNFLNRDMIANIIMAQNFNMPAGYIMDGNTQQLIKVGEQFKSEDEIKNMLLFSAEPIGDILLSDIAMIELVDNSEDMYAKVNGNVGVILTFQKQSTASTAQVATLIENEIDNLQQQHNGLSVRPLMNQGDYIQLITSSVIQNLLFGGLLAILILFLFLKDIKPTIVIAFSIPISLMFALTLMYFSNVTLNVISLSGLALGVGMLVDNSIVVIENIYRLRQQNIPVLKAAVEGARQVSGAVFASTLTTISVFLPIVFTEGLSRQLFTDMGLTIGYSLFASLIVSLTLVPAMGSTLLKETTEKKHPIFDKVVVAYQKALTYVLEKKAVVLFVTIALLGVSIYGATIMGTAFIPTIDSPQMSATLTYDNEMSKEDVFALNDVVVERLLEIEAIETLGATSGSGANFALMSGGDLSSTSLYIILKDQRDLTNKDIENLILEKTSDLDVEVSISSNNMDVTALGGSGIVVNVLGNDIDGMIKIGNEVKSLLQQVEGISEISTSYDNAESEIRVIVDKEKAMRHSLSVAQVFSTISSRLTSTTQSTSLTLDQYNVPIVVIDDSNVLTKETLPDLVFNVINPITQEESEVLLKDIAEIVEAETLLSISRENQSRYVSVNAEIADGYNIGLVSRDFEAILNEVEVADGFSIELAGENETIQESLGDLVLMILLAIVFIYLIMVAQFQSLLSPFIVLFTLPLAFTGGLLLLWILNMELSVIAMLGFLVLAGIVVNNAIVFVSYVNQLREENVDKKQALLLAGKDRIRPIIMTALTTILAMATLALGFGSGAEMMQPMAVVAIGGLTYATFLTLFIIPIMYDLMHKKDMKKVEIEV